MKREQPIPDPTDTVKALCKDENQFSNFERVFRDVMAVSKAEILKREAREKKSNAKARAKKKKD